MHQPARGGVRVPLDGSGCAERVVIDATVPADADAVLALLEIEA